MKYYYLDAEKKVHGPVSEAELRVLYTSGQLRDDTMAAVAGDSGWKPLVEVLNKDLNNCSTWNNALCKCSYCDPEISGGLQDGKCPHCNKEMVQQSRGLWNAFTRAIAKSFDYKGRSTRTEFWGFLLFFYIISLVIEYSSGFLVSESVMSVYQREMQLAQDTKDFSHIYAAYDVLVSDPMVILTTAAYWLYMLVMTFPLLAVTVRRLHDTGRTAVSVILGCAAHLAFFVAIALAIVNISSLFTINQVLEDQMVSDFVAWVLPTLISGFILLIVSLYIFVMMLLPSQPGSNKYGPQKY